jgi:Zn finger protein HypA/HybF involved in hydrogenase expression
MQVALCNCKKCGKVFQRRGAEANCSDCVKLEEEQFTLLYRTLQKSGSQGGIAIEELSAEVKVSVEEIERFYWEGRLSTAGIFLKMPCQACGMMTTEVERRGRYCIKCSEMAANKAGVEIKTVQELDKADAEEARRQKQLALLKKNQPSDKGSRRFGPSSRR